ncbi:glycosyltransferase family 4 protein [Streptomyces lycii]|uniref:Glycosyltransferase family 4 protein n=2 Tax=Streptomyces lycii TaxID=2654337 RepID=A0ABQ7FJD8_9ACTN|nr:glycosyltransferase family 4 protein [Streptomyces lycii]KAF4407363.1 glycosyltransferase family 4 protein [Streptomyces lycii]
MHVVHVLGNGSSGSGVHVRSLAAGLVARGVRVTVCAPRRALDSYDFTGAGAHFAAVASRSDPATVAALRAVCAGADVVHAHGLRAAARAAVALSGSTVPLVLTWHRRPHAEGVRAAAVRLLERRAVRAADIVLGASTELVDRARGRGARDARLGPVALPGFPTGRHDVLASPAEDGDLLRHKARADLGAVERPLLIAVARLERRQGLELLLDAAREWRAIDPQPLLVVAGEGPARVPLQRRIDAENLPVRLLGRRDDAAELLAAADVAILASRWEARSLLVQEALRTGVPLVATAVGGVPELVGDAAELVPYGSVAELAATVRSLLADPERCARLAARGQARVAGWSTEDDTVVQVLSVYDELFGAAPRRHTPGPRP